MFDSLKNNFQPKKFQALTDTRVLGLIGFGIIAVLVSWSGVKTIESNYVLQKQISEQIQKNDVAKLENTNAALKNEYYKTDEFLELAARRQFGKAAPGETVLIVPKKVSLKYTSDLPKTTTENTKVKQDLPFYQQNFNDWMDFFFHRSQK
jgi:cell division protein FtsB